MIEASSSSEQNGHSSARSDTEKQARTSGREDLSLLLHAAGLGDVETMRQIVGRGRVGVNQADYDGRTALHLACSEGKVESVEALLDLGADVNPKDRFGNTPLADAQSYGSVEICRILKERGGIVSEMCAAIPGRRPQIQSKDDHELDPADLDMAAAVSIGKGLFGDVKKARWKGTWVAVKVFQDNMGRDKKAEEEFLEELRILRQLRHPNIVMFLGAVTKSEPHLLVTEYLSGGNLHQLLKRKGTLHADEALRYALDISRGMNYLHQHKPEPVVHRDLTPHNLLRDEAGTLKVADFGLSRIRVGARSLYVRDVSGHGATAALLQLGGTQNSYRYLAPEVFADREATVFLPSVDVFSFAVIVYEMFEGLLVPKYGAQEAEMKYAEDTTRPAFHSSRYPQGMRELIAQCWSHNAEDRPTFAVILERLEVMREASRGAALERVGPKCCAIV